MRYDPRVPADLALRRVLRDCDGLGVPGNMKQHLPGFLDQQHIDHDSEVFDYISELHDYLWKFIRTQYPGAQGNLDEWIDKALAQAERDALR